MAFKFKDLMVDIHPARYTVASLMCNKQNCPITSLGDDSATADPAQHLQQLKAQLREALARVETEEKALAAGETPRTLAEAEELERKLEGALEELREHKRSLA